MNKTNIEWVKNPDGSQGYTWNPITGCLNHDNGLCKGGGFPCYAYKLANGRLKPLYLANEVIVGKPLWKNNYGDEFHLVNPADPFYPRFWEERLEQVDKLHYDLKPKGIFLCDMGDLFGIGVPEDWTNEILDGIADASYHRFYLLTKQPQNLVKFSPFPENAWVGVTCTNQTMVLEATNHLYDHRIAKTQFLSIEPLLSWDTSHFSRPLTDSISKLDIDWLIIGACTGTEKDMMRLCLAYPELLLMPSPDNNKWLALPKIEWVREIVKAADKAGVKVFLKDNLKPLIEWPRDGPWAFDNLSNIPRQEMPE